MSSANQKDQLLRRRAELIKEFAPGRLKKHYPKIKKRMDELLREIRKLETQLSHHGVPFSPYEPPAKPPEIED